MSAGSPCFYLPQKAISAPSAPPISKPTFQQKDLTTNASLSSSEGRDEYMGMGQNGLDIPSRQISSPAWSTKSTMTKKESMSKRLSVWHLPSSFDLETLHGIHGLPNHISNKSPATTLPS